MSETVLPVVTTVEALYRDVHRQIRDELVGLDREALSWVPGLDTSSISTLVRHLLGNEAETLRIVHGQASDRDRATEFAPSAAGSADLLELVDATEQLLGELAPGITEADLAALRVRGGAQRSRTPQTGLFWLLNSYGHAREHLAHLQLTRQLWEQRRA